MNNTELVREMSFIWWTQAFFYALGYSEADGAVVDSREFADAYQAYREDGGVKGPLLAFDAYRGRGELPR